VLALAFDTKGDQLLAGYADRTATPYDTSSRELVRTLPGQLGPVNAVAFSPTGDRMATAGGEGGVKVWETSSGPAVIAFGHSVPPTLAAIQTVVFTSDDTFVTGSADETLKSWTFDGTWSERKPLGPHVFRVLRLDFSPDGTLLAAGGGEPSRSGEVKLWEVGEGRLVRSSDALHCDTVFGVRFSPDGRMLAIELLAGVAEMDACSAFFRVVMIGRRLRTSRGEGGSAAPILGPPEGHVCCRSVARLGRNNEKRGHGFCRNPLFFKLLCPKTAELPD
jgi:WD40 repeat protein